MSAVAVKSSPKEQAEQQIRADAEAFQMPKPPKGSAILWYPHGIKTEQPEVGFVWKVGHRNIVVNLIGGMNKETVRHIDDPKLQMSASQRENGAWDFTDETKELVALRRRIDELEDLIGGEKKPSKPGKEG